MPDIVFVFPPMSGSLERDHIFKYYLGAGYISAFLKSKGISSSHFVSDASKKSLDELVSEILSDRPRVVGFTAYLTNYPNVKRLSHAIKKARPETFVICGGPHATFYDDLILRGNRAIDACVRWEGEYTVHELICALKSGTSLKDIAGITYRCGSRIIRTPERPLIGTDGQKASALDIIPSPYLTGVVPASQGHIGVLTSRGCPYRCVYCIFSAMGRATLRFHSIDRVLQELRLIAQAVKADQRAQIPFIDDTFSMNLVRTKELLRRIIEASLGLEFYVDTRADRVDEELLYLMRDAGVRAINFGLESAVPRVLREIQKVCPRSTKEKRFLPERDYISCTKRYARLAKRLGIKTSVSVILGLPGERYKDGLKTIHFVRALGVDSYGHNYLIVSKGTQIYNTADDYGIQIHQDMDGQTKIKYSYNVYRIPVLKNAGERGFIATHLINLANDVFGIKTRGPVSTLILKEVTKWEKEALEFVRRHASFHANVYSILSPRAAKAVNLDIDRVRANSHLVGNFRYLVSKGTRIEVIKGLYCETRLPSRLILRPFSNPKVDRAQDNLLQSLILTTDKAQDLALLEQMCLELQRDGSITLPAPGRLKWLNPFVPFERMCRYLDHICPGTSIGRLIVQGKGGITTCIRGERIAKLSDNPEKIEQRLYSIYTQTMRRRGCQSCPVRDTCSKCLWTYPLSEAQFCGFRRKHPKLAWVMRLIHLFAMIQAEGELDIKGKDKLSIGVAGGIFAQGAIAIFIGKRYFLCDLEANRFYRVNRPLAVIFNLLRQPLDEQQLLIEVSRLLGCPREAASSAIKDAQEFLKDYNL
jgi:anaerobic magnesium-protoporphyrin IX monomethyl ester cyclase